MDSESHEHTDFQIDVDDKRSEMDEASEASCRENGDAEERAIWMYLQTIPTVQSHWPRQDIKCLTIREDLLMLQEFHDGTYSYTLPNETCIVHSGGNWSVSFEEALPSIQGSDKEMQLSPCPGKIFHEIEIMTIPCYSGFSLKWMGVSGTISVELPESEIVTAKEGIVVADICHHRASSDTSRAEARQQVFDHLSALSSQAEQPRPDLEADNADEKEISVECEAQPLSTDTDATSLSISEEKTRQSIGWDSVEERDVSVFGDGLVAFDLKRGRCVRIHEGEVCHYGDASSDVVGSTHYDPQWINLQIFLLFPNGHAFRVLSYKEGHSTLVEQVHCHGQTKLETTDVSGWYMDSIFLPFGSKRHILLSSPEPQSENKLDAEDVSSVAIPDVLPSLKRPSVYKLSPDAIQSSFVFPRTREERGIPVMIFREIIEAVPNRQLTSKTNQSQEVLFMGTSLSTNTDPTGHRTKEGAPQPFPRKLGDEAKEGRRRAGETKARGREKTARSKTTCLKAKEAMARSKRPL